MKVKTTIEKKTHLVIYQNSSEPNPKLMNNMLNL